MRPAILRCRNATAKSQTYVASILFAALAASSCSDSVASVAAPAQLSATRSVGMSGSSMVPDAPPVASFTVGCFFDPLACTFDSSYSTDDNGIVSYAWVVDQSAGRTASGATAHVSYPGPGYRNVSLTVTDTKGQQSSYGYRMQVGIPAGVPPVGNFGYNCNALTCTFPSTALGSTRVVVSWDFGDGSTTGNVNSPTHTYAKTGTYLATMRMVDGFGVANMWAQVVEIPYPTSFSPGVSFGTSCPSLSCVFFGYAFGNQPISVSWNFGDGTTAGNVLQPSHTYASPGIYVVTLTGVDAIGQTRSSAYAMRVRKEWPNDPPNASFTSSCSGRTCTLDASRSVDDRGIVKYAWDLGKEPGRAAQGPQVVVTYPSAGPRAVTLTVTDTNGQPMSVTQTITIP